MTVSVASILSTVAIITQDPSYTRVGEDFLVRAVNSAQLEIVRMKPGAKIVKAALPLVQGVRQVIPSTGIRLVSVIKNTSGSAVRRADEKEMTLQYPGWSTEQASTTIKAWMPDESDIKAFLVYPQAPSSGASLDITYSAVPEAVTSAGNISLPDEYKPSIEYYVAAIAFGVNTSLADSQRSSQYYQMFMNSIGMEATADAGIMIKRGLNAG